MIFAPQLDWRSAGLFLTIDPKWRQKLWIGGWLLLLPIVGWPLVLGYRRAVLTRVVRGSRPILPEWRGNLREHLLGGLGAMGVIHLHFAPLYVWIGALLPNATEIWLGIALVLVMPLFSTLVVPAGVVYLRYNGMVGDLELAFVSIAYALITFYIPSAFLSASRTGRLASVFDVTTNIRLIVRAPRRYVEAWIGSSLLSLVGHLCIPLTPFGVVWSYLAIVFFFNEVPMGLEAERRSYLQRSWFPYFRVEYWDQFRASHRGWFTYYESPEGKGFAAAEIGPLRVPLPWGGSMAESESPPRDLAESRT